MSQLRKGKASQSRRRSRKRKNTFEDTGSFGGFGAYDDLEDSGSFDSDGSPPPPPPPPATATAPQEPSPTTNAPKEGSSRTPHYRWEPKKKKKSPRWEHYEEVTTVNAKGKRVGTCKYCKEKIIADGTSSLKRHTERCNNSPHKVTLENFFPKEGAEGSGPGGSRPPLHPSISKFDQLICRRELVRMFIVAELSFRFVENEAFRKFLKVLQPRFEVPSRRTLVRDILQMYGEEKARLGSFIRSLKGKVCLTTDLWTSCQKFSYLSLTAHFIDNDWKLHKKILNFAQVSSHTGDHVGRTISEKLEQWNITRVLSVTVDNASSNNVLVSVLNKCFMKWDKGYVLNGDYAQMRCLAHILNLIVQEGLKEIDWSILRVRAAIKYVRASTSRFGRFKAHAKAQNIASDRMVCLDVETRWNSTYKMLDVALMYQKVFQRLEGDEIEKYTEELEQGVGVPTDEDWNHIRSILPFLKAFYNATVRISGSSYVTANSYIVEVSSIGLLIKKSLNHRDSGICRMAESMTSKFKKYWGDASKVNMLLMIALVLDPRQKTKGAKYYFDTFFDTHASGLLEHKLEESLKSIFEQYRIAMEGVTTEQPMHIVDDDDDDDDDDCTGAYWRATGNTKQSDSSAELERYLDEGLEPYSREIELDLLNWWKANSVRLPVLASIARDVLAIPVSTVASESAFSTGGRVLSEYRSCLDPSTAEGLICTQDWIRGAQFSFLSDEDFDELEKIHNDFIEEEKTRAEGLVSPHPH